MIDRVPPGEGEGMSSTDPFAGSLARFRAGVVAGVVAGALVVTGLLLAPQASASTPADSATVVARAAAKPTVLRDCTAPAVRPHHILLDCFYGTEILRRIHWRTWSATRATGHGRDVLVRSHRWRAHVVLRRPRTVHADGVNAVVFTRIVVVTHHRGHTRRTVEKLYDDPQVYGWYWAG